MIYFIIWYISGVLGGLYLEFNLSGDVTIGDIFQILVVGFLGGLVSIMAIVLFLKQTGVLDKKIFIKKESKR